MKRVFFAFAVSLVVITVAALIALKNPHTIASFVLSKALGNDVRVTRVSYRSKGSDIYIELSDLLLKGAISGRVKRWELMLNLRSRPLITRSTLSDFDITVKEAKGTPTALPFAVRLVEAKNGTLTYRNERFIIHEVRMENVGTSKPFTFAADLEDSAYFRHFKASGGGAYKDELSDAKGQFSITGMNLTTFWDHIDGKSDLKGTFIYADKKLLLKGPFEISQFEMKDRFLRKPLRMERLKGDIALTAVGNARNIQISNVPFHDGLFRLSLKIEGDDLANLELSAETVDVKDLKDYLALESIGLTSFDIWTLLQGGRISTGKFSYGEKTPANAEIKLRGASVLYQKIRFTKVDADLRIDEKKMDISNTRGTFNRSLFYDVAGKVLFSEDAKVQMKVRFSVNLGDIPSMFDVGAFRFKTGTTEGTMELEGTKGGPFKISGTGRFQSENVGWEKMSASARGSYRFTNDEVSFDPLILNRGGTDMVIRGKWNKKYMGMWIKGSLDVDHIKPVVKTPFSMDGIVDLDTKIEKREDVFIVNGDINMDDFSFEVPGTMRKDRGLPSRAHLTATVASGDVVIENLSYNIDAIDVALKGTIAQDKTMNLDIAMDVREIGGLAKLLFFENETAKGDAELRLTLRDLRLPMRRLPRMNGHIRVNNGLLRLPGMGKPLKEIDLSSDFSGKVFDVRISKLTCGKSVLRNGTLHVDGLESPRFSLFLDMEMFDLADFQDEFEFRIYPIKEESILARASGDMELRTKQLKLGRVAGENLLIKGVLSERKLNVSELKTGVWGGSADIHGTIDFSRPLPNAYATGWLRNIQSGFFLALFGGKTQAVNGRSTLFGSLSAEGSSTSELIRKMNGSVTVFSKNGVIARWNLLAKIFGLLNVSDYFRGKARFSVEGLPYSRMGGTFVVENGVFHTENFLIDSPSMLITGKGGLDMAKNEIDGDIAVSPLVAFDRAIDKIPILRNIFREKDKGFLYAAYTVKGPIDDPDIKLSVMNSIGGRTIDILRNILILPKEIFDQQ